MKCCISYKRINACCSLFIVQGKPNFPILHCILDYVKKCSTSGETFLELTSEILEILETMMLLLSGQRS